MPILTQRALCFALALSSTAASIAALPAGAAADAARAPAAPAYDVRTERLQGLTRTDLEPLEALLQRGPVALVEFVDNNREALPGINVAAIVHAPARDVMALVSKPEAYPRFMGTLDTVEIVERKGPSVVYDWRWQMSLLTFAGRNSMTVYEAPKERSDAGYRATINSQSGDLGKGRMSIRVWPRGEKESLLVVSMRIDLREANYVARALARAGRSINRTANMSLTYSMVLSLRHEAERRAGFAAPAQPKQELHQPELDKRTVLPLLARGDLVLLDLTGDRLNQIGVIGLIGKRRSLVHEVMLDTNAFGSALLPGSAATLVSKEGAVTTFDWDIDLPLVGVSGRMRMRDADPLVAVDAVGGALAGGRWNFETTSLGKDATLITSWASFDVRNSSWFVRRLVDADPYFGHGVSAASEVMLVRALRSRASKRADTQVSATAPPSTH